MKTTWMKSLLALSLIPMGAAGYQKADDFEQAKALVKDDGYMVMAYADGWDTYSKQSSRKLLADASVQKAMADAVLLEFAVKNAPSKEDFEAVKKRFGSLDLPNPSQYPALYLYDGKGRRYATICIPYKERHNASFLASQIMEKKAALQQQQELLKQSQPAKGADKARLLGKAAAVNGIEWPDNVIKQIKEADPKDESGYVRRMELNLWGFAERISKEEDWRKALAEVEEKLQDPAYTNEQKQVFYASAIGLYHRHGGIEGLAKIREYAPKMKALAPDSTLGQSATTVIREWATGLTLSEGWSPSNLPADKTPVEVEGPIPINQPGAYTVSFKWTRGSKGLIVTAVELYDGKAKIAEDRHNGFAGIKTDKPDYELKVPRPVRDPHLFITVDMVNSRDSSGNISVTKK